MQDKKKFNHLYTCNIIFDVSISIKQSLCASLLAAKDDLITILTKSPFIEIGKFQLSGRHLLVMVKKVAHRHFADIIKSALFKYFSISPNC